MSLSEDILDLEPSDALRSVGMIVFMFIIILGLILCGSAGAVASSFLKSNSKYAETSDLKSAQSIMAIIGYLDIIIGVILLIIAIIFTVYSRKKGAKRSSWTTFLFYLTAVISLLLFIFTLGGTIYHYFNVVALPKDVYDPSKSPDSVSSGAMQFIIVTSLIGLLLTIILIVWAVASRTSGGKTPEAMQLRLDKIKRVEDEQVTNAAALKTEREELNTIKEQLAEEAVNTCTRVENRQAVNILNLKYNEGLEKGRAEKGFTSSVAASPAAGISFEERLKAIQSEPEPQPIAQQQQKKNQNKQGGGRGGGFWKQGNR